MKRILFGILMSSITLSSYAQSVDVQASANNVSLFQLGIYAALGIGILLLVLAFYLLAVANRLLSEFKYAADESAFDQELIEESKKLTFWERTFQLKPLSMERHILLDENYDGIAELNNPTPPWFMWLFYSTILFAVVYLLSYHVFEVTPLSAQEYKNEVAEADRQTKLYLAASGASITEETVKQLTDAGALNRGKEIFTSRCVTCHGDLAEGKQGLGPNLTDAYWLHGGSIKEVFHTITEGVAGKGMISWKAQLSPDKIRDVASYVLSLQGSNPPNAKAPEGTIAGASTQPDSTQSSDSLHVKTVSPN